MQNAKYKSRGIGLLELMLSLLVIVIIIFTATRYFGVANENLKVAQGAEMINNIVDASYKWLQGQPDFTGISLDGLVKAQLLPNTYYQNPWHGAVEVRGNPNNTNAVAIVFHDIPPAACINLAEKMEKYLKIPSTPEQSCPTFGNGVANYLGNF